MQTVLKCNNTIAYANVIVIIQNIVVSKEINYTCIALSQFKSKKAPHNNFYENKWFLDPGASIYFILFKFDFVDMTPDNYGQIETANSKASLYMIAFNSVLIEYKIYILNMQMCLFSTE